METNLGLTFTTMLDFEEARRRVLAACLPLETEEVDVSSALGRVLAEDLVTLHQLPPFDYSAMDGFAVRSSDFRGAPPPYELPIRGEARAGGGRLELSPNTAARIFTGAELPRGADSVIIQEDTELRGDDVLFRTPPEPFENVRRAGEDLQRGMPALARGTRLNPFQLGFLASLDRASVRVSRRPRVALLSTGDELRPPGSAFREGSIPDSNSVAIRALAAQTGAEALVSAHATDDLTQVGERLRELTQAADVLVTIGGVSVGKHDVVRAALENAGARLEFWKVAIKPGKPFTFGRLDSTLVLGLPGNPVSAQITFALFGMPLLRALQGELEPTARMERVVLGAPFQQRPGRLGVYRARLSGHEATLADNQASGSTVSLAKADALVFVPAETTDCARGSELDAIRLRDL